MSNPRLSSETLHASCVARDGRAILISGPSGAGKSDLALRLIDRGAVLVSDDYTVVRRVGGRLLASAPPHIRGKIEVRGIGIVPLDQADDMPVCLLVELGRKPARMPQEDESVMIAGVRLPTVVLDASESAAPIKAELALTTLGLGS